MENPIKHYYSISNIVLGKTNEYQFNFYAGDYLRERNKSFDSIKIIEKKEISMKLEYFIEILPSKRMDFLKDIGTDVNCLGYYFESDYFGYAFLFFKNHTEIVESREENRIEDYTGIVSNDYDQELQRLRNKAVFVNHKQEQMAYYSALL